VYCVRQVVKTPTVISDNPVLSRIVHLVGLTWKGLIIVSSTCFEQVSAHPQEDLYVLLRTYIFVKIS